MSLTHSERQDLGWRAQQNVISDVRMLIEGAKSRERVRGLRAKFIAKCEMRYLRAALKAVKKP